jgi:hypothetical protein
LCFVEESGQTKEVESVEGAKQKAGAKTAEYTAGTNNEQPSESETPAPQQARTRALLHICHIITNMAFLVVHIVFFWRTSKAFMSRHVAFLQLVKWTDPHLVAVMLMMWRAPEQGGSNSACPAPVAEDSPAAESKPAADSKATAESKPAKVSRRPLTAPVLEAVRQLCGAIDDAAAAPARHFAPRGLVNTGNLCFMNSILQVGAHIWAVWSDRV